MSDNVSRGDGYKQREEHRVYLFRLSTCAVEEYGEEADGDVENLAGDLVSMNLSLGQLSHVTEK
jgi:hypothetical protein